MPILIEGSVASQILQEHKGASYAMHATELAKKEAGGECSEGNHHFLKTAIWVSEACPIKWANVFCQ